MKYVFLAVLWMGWCFIHSVLISRSVTDYMKCRIGPGFQYYRLFYNFLAVISLIPVVLYTFLIQDLPFFAWHGYLRIVQILLVYTSLFLFIAGMRHFDIRVFLGIRQLQEKTDRTLLTRDNMIDMTGILGVIRHPWYLGALLIIWARNIDLSALIVNIVLTAYIVLGTVLEEQKLVLGLGNEYREYQKKVSRFIPCKWLVSKVKKR